MSFVIQILRRCKITTTHFTLGSKMQTLVLFGKSDAKLHLHRKPHVLNFSRSPVIDISIGSKDQGDVELSYTTYPDHEHEDSVDKTKQPVMFLHGLFGAKGNLHSVCKHLSAKGRKIIPYDARNHGDSDHHPDMDLMSMANDLVGLIDDLKLDKPVVMGHSMGGKTAMIAALSKPDAVSALIVADVMPTRSPNMQNLKHFAEEMKKVTIPQGTSIIQARRMAKTKLAPIVEKDGILQFLLTNLKEVASGTVRWRINLDSMIKDMDRVGDFPVDSFKPFTKPTLFVFGADSEHYSPSSENMITALFPEAKVKAIPGAGHFLHADKPLEFVEIVNEFLEFVDKTR